MNNRYLRSYGMRTTGKNSGSSLKTIHSPEEGASVCRTAIETSNDILGMVNNLRENIKNAALPNSNGVYSLRSEMIKQHLIKIDNLAKTSQFSGHFLLNGDSGVKGETIGRGLKFIRGGKNTNIGIGENLPVNILALPEKSFLCSRVEVTSSLIKKEKYIYFKISGKHYEFNVSDLSTVEEFVNSFRLFSLYAGLDISLGMQNDGRACFFSNQAGESFKFSVLSAITNMFHDGEKNFAECEKGKNISAKIGDMETIGLGNFIIGLSQGSPSDGVILSYDGLLNYPGEKVGEVKLFNGNWIYKGVDDTFTQISLPNLKTQHLGQGVTNRSRFSNLSQIKVEDMQQKNDSLLIANWAVQDIRYVIAKLEATEEQFIQKAIQALNVKKNEWLPKGSEITNNSEAMSLVKDLSSNKQFQKGLFV